MVTESLPAPKVMLSATVEPPVYESAPAPVLMICAAVELEVIVSAPEPVVAVKAKVRSEVSVKSPVKADEVNVATKASKELTVRSASPVMVTAEVSTPSVTKAVRVEARLVELTTTVSSSFVVPPPSVTVIVPVELFVLRVIDCDASASAASVKFKVMSAAKVFRVTVGTVDR